MGKALECQWPQRNAVDQAFHLGHGLAIHQDLTTPGLRTQARRQIGAILGDGALTSGMAYEGLNNAGHSDRDIIVVLNDNEMSIAPNVGAMHKYLVSVQRPIGRIGPCAE